MASSTTQDPPPAYELRDIAEQKVRDKPSPGDQAPDLERNESSPPREQRTTTTTCENCKSSLSTRILIHSVLGLLTLGFAASGLYLLFHLNPTVCEFDKRQWLSISATMVGISFAIFGWLALQQSPYKDRKIWTTFLVLLYVMMVVPAVWYSQGWLDRGPCAIARGLSTILNGTALTDGRVNTTALVVE